MTAQSQADRRRSRRRKLERLPGLRAEVIRCLNEGWSPEQIAGRLRIEPAAPHRLCHETIYQYVYSVEGQSAQLARLLPERRRKRKPRHARTPRNRVFPVETSIHNRPSEINDRSQFGNWEGDLMIFERAQGDANVATLVERKTRYTVLLRNNDRKSKPLMNRLTRGARSPLTAAWSSWPGASWKPAWARRHGSATHKRRGKKARSGTGTGGSAATCLGTLLCCS